MQVWMQVQLDPNYYGQAAWGEDVEHYDSLKKAQDAFWRVCDGERMCDPINHEALIFFYDPTEEVPGAGDPYPDRVLRLGPRGGVRVEHC